MLYEVITLTHGIGAPVAVDSEREESVEKIVTGSDGVEHLADATPLIG